MKTPAKINASRDESGKMLIGLEGTGAGLLLLAGRIASGVLVTVASNEKELAELKNVMHKMMRAGKIRAVTKRHNACNTGCGRSAGNQTRSGTT